MPRYGRIFLLSFLIGASACSASPPAADTPAADTPSVGLLHSPSIVPSVAAASPALHTAWSNEDLTPWQIQFSGEIDTSVAAGVYDLDAFDTDTSVVALLHSRGIKTICYLNAGAWEDWRPDRDRFPITVLGSDYEGWPGEKWLDIRQMDSLDGIMQSRLDLCREKGFDGVEFDNVDGFENDTGFSLSAQDQLAYNAWLAGEAHARGLAAGLKNDPEQAGVLANSFDFAVVESCLSEGWCNLLAPFMDAGKPVFAVEYTEISADIGKYCPQARILKINLILKHLELDSWRGICR